MSLEQRIEQLLERIEVLETTTPFVDGVDLAVNASPSGQIALTGGEATEDLPGGRIVVNGGSSVIDGQAGGGILIQAGDANVGNANGGNVVINAGNKVGTGTAGHVLIQNGIGSFADDAAAATGGVPVGGLYRTASAIKIRVV